MTILLVRHAEPVPPGDPRFEENDRPLSASGRAAADRLALDLAGEPVTAIWSSPYPRARQTVEPLARRVGIEIETVDDLRERLLSPGPLPDWREHLERTWLDDGHRLPGGESNAEAAARIAGVVADAGRAARSGTVVLASHGNLIALALRGIRPAVDMAFWEAMPMPAVYRLAGGDVSGPGLGAQDPGGLRGG